ncbi:MAG: 50S ribosomal protein L18 [Candidatus Altimarinota bacterium]
MTNLKITARKRRQARVKGKVFGTDRHRLVVFRSLNNNYAQLVDDQKHQTIASASDLKVTKGTKMERAKQVGIELAKLALEKNIKTCVFDRNGYRYHGRIKALADGAREGGLKF